MLNLKGIVHKQKKNEDLKGKVLDNAGDLLNELRYIYKERQKKRRCFK